MQRAVFLAAIGSAATVAVAPCDAATFGTAFSPAELRGDLDALWNAMLEVETAPFLTSVRQDVEARYHRVRESLTEPMDVSAFWLRVAPVFAALNDGHVAILPPFATVEGVRVPLRLRLDSNELIVDGSADDAIAHGSVLVSIDDRPAVELRDLALSVAGAQSVSLRRERVLVFGRLAVQALLGLRRDYRVRWVAPDGTAHDRRIAAAIVPSPDDDGVPYTYHTLENDTIGYIDYRACVDRPLFAQFLSETFRTLREQRVRALVIDVRENGGGDAALNDDLWSYVATRPFRQIGATISRVSGRLKREYGRARYVAEFGAQAWEAKEGTLVRHDYPLIDPGANPLRFAGPVYLLISARTFSSGMGCAIAAKDYGLATVVGEETGEPVNGTGELYTMRTPATRLLGGFPTKVFVSPIPSPEGQGVVPDIIVPTMRADLIAGHDPVLDRVLREIA